MLIKKSQQGIMLIEALIGILIFSIGILALIGMQAHAINTVTDSKYRTDASVLANQLVSKMWGDAGNINLYAYSGGGVPAQLNTWAIDLVNTLPGVGSVSGGVVTFSIGMAPTVTIATDANSQTSAVITVRWKTPKAVNTRTYVTSTYIGN